LKNAVPRSKNGFRYAENSFLQPENGLACSQNAVRAHAVCPYEWVSALIQRFQRAGEVFDDVVGVLEAEREAEETGGDF
jgi:hypothetical protein